MTSSPTIRPIQTPDQSAVIALWDQVFPGEAAWNDPVDVIARKLQVQPELFFVAVSDDTVIGTVMAGFDGVRGWVHHLAVHPNHRREGIATELMKRAEAGLKSAGCPKLNLQVRSTNLGVIKFYQSLGFYVEERANLGKPLI
ncbi:MAG: GNAT family acetyltransferase [Pseudomonadota bacterium]